MGYEATGRARADPSVKKPHTCDRPDRVTGAPAGGARAFVRNGAETRRRLPPFVGGTLSPEQAGVLEKRKDLA